ncbi:MAG: DNA-processing protein DprA [Spirochaetes bacterium]|nr:DNA-processing protein DprA [Spirochaetota bacterium]
MNSTIYDLALSFDQSLTKIEKIFLFKQYGSSEKILKFPVQKIKNLVQRGWTGHRFQSRYFIDKAKEIYPYLTKAGIKTIRFDHPSFPAGLKEIPDPPFLLYYRGSLEFNYYQSAAIVGTRKPDMQGKQKCRQFSSYLTKEGFTIISGLALGIDGIAHEFCLRHNGQTIAVLGCGIDRIYPAANRELGRAILTNGGAIVSEYPPGIEPRRWYFPHRNRIIVGLSRSVLIIQSPEKSGSLISAQLAADYNRDLYVVDPGQKAVDAGNRNLIQNGATKVACPEEFIYHHIY